MAAGSGEGIKNGQKMDFHADPKLACSFLRSRITSFAAADVGARRVHGGDPKTTSAGSGHPEK
jgi:hypothetical protein